MKLFILFCLLELHCYSSNLDTVYTRQYKVENHSRNVITFAIGVNENDHSTMEGLANAVRHMPDEFPGEPLERKAWRFTIKNLDYNIPLSDSIWLHAPLLFLHSAGFGICDDLATFLAHLWRALGLKARVWNIRDHSVPEVFINDRWQMYDPTFRVYFKTADDDIAGVADLFINPDLITKPFERLVLPGEWAPEFLFQNDQYSEKMVGFYNTINVNEWYDRPFIENMTLSLPPMGILEFPVNSPDPLQVKDLTGSASQLNYYLKITLPPGFRGPVLIPYILTSISGKGIVSAGKQIYDLNQKKMIFDPDKDTPQDTVFVKESHGPIEIYCLVNPALYVSDTLSVKLIGEKAEQLKLTKQDNVALLID